MGCGVKDTEILKEFQIVAAVGTPVHMVDDCFDGPVVATKAEAHVLSMVDARGIECSGDGAWALGLAAGNEAKSSGPWGGALTTHPKSKAIALGKNSMALAVGGLSTACAGEAGVIAIGYLDASGRLRLKVGYVGEGGIEAGVHYQLDDDGEFEVVLDAEGA